MLVTYKIFNTETGITGTAIIQEAVPVVRLVTNWQLHRITCFKIIAAPAVTIATTVP
jgi:hypothetical protein